MPPSDRLEELQRQRARLTEQLARLEHEIATMAARPNLKNPGPEAADPDQILREHADPPANPAAVKSGCVALFILGSAVVAAALVAVYYAFYR